MKFSSSLRSKLLCISGLDVTVPLSFFSCIYLDDNICALDGVGVLVTFCYDETLWLNKEFIGFQRVSVWRQREGMWQEQLRVHILNHEQEARTLTRNGMGLWNLRHPSPTVEIDFFGKDIPKWAKQCNQLGTKCSSVCDSGGHLVQTTIGGLIFRYSILLLWRKDLWKF